MADKVMSPPKSPSGRKGIVQANSSIISGPTATTGNFNAFSQGKGSVSSKKSK